MFANRLLVAAVCGALFACAAVGMKPADPTMPVPQPPAMVQPPAQQPQPAPRTVSVWFKDAKWDEVLAWYAKETGLTMITTVKPKGQFNFTPPREKRFTLEELTDVLNEALAQQKMILIRRHMTFFIQSTDERLDGSRVRVDLADLDRLDRWEYVSVVIVLKKTKPDDLVRDARKLLGPSGSIVLLQKGLLVQDTVGNLRQIAKLIRASEGPADEPAPPGAVPAQPVAEKMFAFSVRVAKWDDVFDWYAKASGLTADIKAKPTGTLTFTPAKDRKFTLGELTDLFNESLEEQKLYLFRGNGSFVVVPSDAKVDPKLIPAVELKDLGTRGRSELVEVAFPPGNPGAFDKVTDELEKLLTPRGEILYAKGKWLILRDTVGNIQRIRTTCGDLRR
jgi:hypothetical protein